MHLKTNLFYLILIYISAVEYLYDQKMSTGQSACESKKTADASLLNQYDLLLETLWDNLRDEIRDAKSSIASDRYDTNIQESKTMAFIGTGALWIVHSIVSF